MDVVAIINPISGAGMDGGVAARRVALIDAELKRRKLRSSIHLTERGGHGAELAAAAAAARVPLVIVWGGDGTLNEAGGARAGSETTVGLIPAGSGNGLANALHVPRDPALALELALGNRCRAIDVGVLGTRRFLNVAGIGVDARIAMLFNQRARGSRGRWPYVSIGLREGLRYRASEYRVQLDGIVIQRRALLIVFANGREFGMGAVIAPVASLDDGLLDALVIDDRPVAARFWDARHLARGTLHVAPGILQQKVRAAVVESQAPLEFHVDGEPGCAEGTLEVGVMPRALKVKAI